jgi:hypothetical protein
MENGQRCQKSGQNSPKNDQQIRKNDQNYRKASKINTREIAPLYIPTFPYCLTTWRDKSNGKCAKKY